MRLWSNHWRNARRMTYRSKFRSHAWMLMAIGFAHATRSLASTTGWSLVLGLTAGFGAFYMGIDMMRNVRAGERFLHEYTVFHDAWTGEEEHT